jgi:hypothetical protein
MLAHFMPFSRHNPIRLSGKSVVKVFDSTTFTPRSSKVIANWNAIHECVDQRDAKRLRKCQTKILQSKKPTHALCSHMPSDYFDNPESYVVADLDANLDELDPTTAFMHEALAGANWFDAPCANTITVQLPLISHDCDLPNPFDTFSDSLKRWEHEIKTKSNEAAAA